MIRFIYRAFVFYLLIFSSCSSVAAKFEQHVRNLGFITNSTGSRAFQDQQAGYYTGGSFTTRSNIENQRFANIRLPSIKAGCGGIDLYMGGVSFISVEKFKELGQSILTNSLGYVFEIGLETMSPVIANTLNKLRSIVNQINSQNINSCQSAAAITGSLFSATESGRRLACQAKNAGSNAVGDYFSSRVDCGNRGDGDMDHSSPGAADKGLDDLLGGEYNLVFEALKQDYGNDRELMQLLMSISGTFISRLHDNKLSFEYHPSLFKTPDAISGLLDNNNFLGKLYSCGDPEKCLELEIQEKQLEGSSGLINKVRDIVDEVASKLRAEKTESHVELTDEATKLINSSSLPILKIITLELVLKDDTAPISGGIGEYIEIIAFDLLLNYLEEMLDKVYRAMTVMEQKQFDVKKIKEFRQELLHVERSFHNQRKMVRSQANFIFRTKQIAASVDAQLKMKFNEFGYE